VDCKQTSPKPYVVRNAHYRTLHTNISDTLWLLSEAEARKYLYHSVKSKEKINKLHQNRQVIMKIIRSSVVNLHDLFKSKLYCSIWGYSSGKYSPSVGPSALYQFISHIVGKTLGWGISPSQGLCLYTGPYRNKTNAEKYQRLLGNKPTISVFSGRDSSCLRPRDLWSATKQIV
jgi:hypothetical protein